MFRCLQKKMSRKRWTPQHRSWIVCRWPLGIKRTAVHQVKQTCEVFCDERFPATNALASGIRHNGNATKSWQHFLSWILGPLHFELCYLQPFVTIFNFLHAVFTVLRALIGGVTPCKLEICIVKVSFVWSFHPKNPEDSWTFSCGFSDQTRLHIVQKQKSIAFDVQVGATPLRHWILTTVLSCHFLFVFWFPVCENSHQKVFSYCIEGQQKLSPICNQSGKFRQSQKIEQTSNPKLQDGGYFLQFVQVFPGPVPFSGFSRMCGNLAQKLLQITSSCMKSTTKVLPQSTADSSCSSACRSPNFPILLQFRQSLRQFLAMSPWTGYFLTLLFPLICHHYSNAFFLWVWPPPHEPLPFYCNIASS